MRSWKAIVIAILALVVIGNWIIFRPEPTPPPPSAAPETRQAEPSVAEMAPGPDSAPAARLSNPDTPKPRTEESRAASRRELESPLVSSYPPSTPAHRKAADSDPEITADFDQVSLMFRAYRALTGENPIGNNAEIMKALNGGNPKGAQLGPPDGRGLNEKGELTDRWGTPYFFHALTKDLMEIRSAGPDQRMWNEDDLIGD
ncbi:MAG: hypothetical protein V4584_16720 [Verrucomicrobiota bacterium]